MSNSPYVIRNYQPADFDRFALLKIEAEELEPTGRCISPQCITEALGRPGYSPGQDLFVVEIGGNLVGYMDVTPELTIGRVILDCWIYPEHRKKGLGTGLFGYAIHRAMGLGVKVAQVNIMRDNEAAKGILVGLGFRYVRRFLELRLDMTEVRWPDIDRTAPGSRHLEYGEEDKLARIQNRSFAGSWGYNPNTVEQVTYHTNLSSRSPEDVVLAYDGDEVAGYCWTGVINEGEAAVSGKKGRIFMLGVDPGYRGRGIGKRVLLAGLAHLRDKKTQLVELTVDSENEIALALYRSVGFEVRTSSLWYEKAVD
ncbi:GNAT family N-acetyltransferase [Chloroflexota bacterium]